ncbi:hypothetical protein EYF80_034688 [Liparis tanakae]|uniref:Uncharacterized protein n=1 Tax=Liparis tanakae TaxID=230148 RepID=A0A4Z2GQV0_9TELE|nr:hypothetical protein EYF80_034688 [Liparis tanakae]
MGLARRLRAHLRLALILTFFAVFEAEADAGGPRLPDFRPTKQTSLEPRGGGAKGRTRGGAKGGA